MRKWWKRAAFDQRLRAFLSIVIVLTAAVIVVVSTISSISSVTRKSRDLMMMQVKENASTVSNKLISYYDMSVAIMLDSRVQSYLQTPAFETYNAYVQHVDSVRNALNSFYSMSGDINFISVIRSWPSGYVLKGSKPPLFDEYYERDREQSIKAGVGALRLSRSDTYYPNRAPTLSVYTPVFNTVRINKVIGQLCINVGGDLLSSADEQEQPGIPFDALLFSVADNVVFRATHSDISKDGFHYADRLDGDSGSFGADGQLYVYHRVAGSHFYVIGATPFSSLYRDSINTMVLLIMLIIIMVAASLVISNYLVKRMYQSLNRLKIGMDAVSHGHLDVRLEAQDEGRDFETIFTGFNSMTTHIQRLMERVKEEERQIEQIRYNALQAQIHPHFLYNTLDCIRWMANADGNAELVKLVKAMARFYRTCLSRGKDVITLDEELHFTESYMTIQNIRYGGIIHFEVNVPEELLIVRIPKITLQPLVENCVMHGFKNESPSFTVRVTGSREDNCALIVITDDGAGMSEADTRALNASLETGGEDIGFGARNVHQRIVLLFGVGYGLSYAASESGGVSATIRLPLG